MEYNPVNIIPGYEYRWLIDDDTYTNTSADPSIEINLNWSKVYGVGNWTVDFQIWAKDVSGNWIEVGPDCGNSCSCAGGATPPLGPACVVRVVEDPTATITPL